MSEYIQPVSGGQYRLDDATRFWADESRDHATPLHNSELNESLADVDDDVRSSFNEAKGRGEVDDELEQEQSRASIEVLRNGFGSIQEAARFYEELDGLYRTDPARARELHQRYYRQRTATDAEIKPKPPKEQPHPDLDERARDEWELEQAAKDAWRTAGDRQSYREDLEAAKPYLSILKDRHGSLTRPLLMASVLHEAMKIAPEAASTTTAMKYGLPTSAAHQNEMIQAQQYEQSKATLAEGVDYLTANGMLPGMERPEVEDAVVQVLHHMTNSGQRSEDPYNDLYRAYHAVASGQYGEAMQAAYARDQQAQEQRHAEKARRASRSLSGSPSTGDVVYATPNHARVANLEDDIVRDVARAVRSSYI